jgi:multiple sugar transport system permease protein
MSEENKMATTEMKSQQRSEPLIGYRARKILGRIAIYLVLTFIALLIILPLLWMLSTSFKPRAWLFAPEIHWIPPVFTLANYERLFANPATPILRWFMNSVYVATLVTVLILIIDALAAYAYARMKFPGRKLIFTLLLATLFLPGIMFLIPTS